MIVRQRAKTWSAVALAVSACLFAGRLIAQDSFTGSFAGQQRTQHPWIGTFCWCPPGEFTMGEKNDPRGNARQVDVKITRGFWMGNYEVTQAQYEFVMKENPSQFRGAFLPVEMVRWTEATEYCEKLTAQALEHNQLPMGWEFRLPTEAQWEYACRAGTNTRYSFGDDPSKLDDYAWHANNSGTDEGLQRLRRMERAAIKALSVDEAQAIREMQTHPVGLKKPNRWGLCDMHGNVAEWCRDSYQQNLPGGADPFVHKEDANHIFRGGNWCATSVRSAYRHPTGISADARSSSLGFRIVAVRIK